jgi:hypothetical protein
MDLEVKRKDTTGIKKLIGGGEKDWYSVFGNQKASLKGNDLMIGDDGVHFGNGVKCSGQRFKQETKCGDVGFFNDGRCWRISGRWW